jgi:hypothetical protein
VTRPGATLALSADASSALKRLAAAYAPRRTRVSDPVTCHRKATDTPAPTGLAAQYEYEPNTNDSRQRGGRYGTYYRPTVEYLAGNAVPATARVSATVAPRGGMPQKAPRRTVSSKSRKYFPGTGYPVEEHFRLIAVARHSHAVTNGL